MFLTAITLAGVISSYTVDVTSTFFDDSGIQHSTERSKTYYSGDLVGDPWSATFDESSYSFNFAGKAISLEDTYFDPPSFGGSTIDAGSGEFRSQQADFGPLTNHLLGTFVKSEGNDSSSITYIYHLSPVGYVPEPGTWFILLVGFGLLGASLRKRPLYAKTC